MISSMLSLDPTNRPSFERLLSDFRNLVFPEHFYAFLPDYFAAPAPNPLAQNQNLGKSGVTPAQKGFGRADDVVAMIAGDWRGRIRVALREGSQRRPEEEGREGEGGEDTNDRAVIDSGQWVRTLCPMHKTLMRKTGYRWSCSTPPQRDHRQHPQLRQTVVPDRGSRASSRPLSFPLG